MNEPIHNQLGQHAEGLIADVLDKREATIINAVQAAIEKGVLDPQFAIQQWLALNEGRRLRATLIHRGKLEVARRAAAS